MVSTKALESDIEYPLRSNALSAKSVLGGRVALTYSSLTDPLPPISIQTIYEITRKNSVARAS